MQLCRTPTAVPTEKSHKQTMDLALRRRRSRRLEGRPRQRLIAGPVISGASALALETLALIPSLSRDARSSAQDEVLRLLYRL